MAWPTVSRKEDGSATVVIGGQTVSLGPLASLDADKTALILRLFLEMLFEMSAVPQTVAKIATMRTMLGQLRAML